jgi:Nickel responsive protein SCO4226-like
MKRGPADGEAEVDPSDSSKGVLMAKFMDVHSGFVGVTEDQLREAHERDLEIEATEGVHFERAWLDPESGKVFCLSSGPSKEAVLRVHDKAGHPTSEIYELPVEVE